jgi:uncharacterized protein (TIGR00369 family)
VENGIVVIDYTSQPTDAGYKHTIHGGICMTLLDEVMTWAAILASGGVCVAAEMTTRLKAPAEAGRKLRVEGWLVKHTRRLNLTEGRILDEDGTLIAEANGKYMPYTAPDARLQEEDFVKDASVILPGDILK